MPVLLIVIGLLVALAAIGFILYGRHRTALVEVQVLEKFGGGLLREPPPVSPNESPPIVEKPYIGWAKQFEPRSGGLSDEARLRLINDLGLLRAPWCIALLTQAYEQETDSANRAAAQLALARCREENVV